MLRATVELTANANAVQNFIWLDPRDGALAPWFNQTRRPGEIEPVSKWS